MQHVKMLETRDGASDRVTVKTYKEGNVYEISDELAEIFIDDGAADPADAEDAADNVPDLDDLDTNELLAKVLELDPSADPAAVLEAIAANRDGVLEKLKELEADDDDEGGKKPDPEPDVDDEFKDLSNRDLIALAKTETISIPFTARSRAAKIELIKAARLQRS